MSTQVYNRCWILSSFLVPMDPSIKLSSENGELIPNAEAYRRPHICFVVHKLCHIPQLLEVPHLKAAYNVLHYLKETISQTLFYPVDDDFQAKAYRDSDWSQWPDSQRFFQGFASSLATLLFHENRRNKTSFLIHLLRLTIDIWPSLLNKVVWLSLMVNDLHGSTVPFLYCDSTAALHIAKNSIFHEKTKHIKRNCHSIREKIVAGLVKTLHVRSENQLSLNHYILLCSINSCPRWFSSSSNAILKGTISVYNTYKWVLPVVN